MQKLASYQKYNTRQKIPSDFPILDSLYYPKNLQICIFSSLWKEMVIYQKLVYNHHAIGVW